MLELSADLGAVCVTCVILRHRRRGGLADYTDFARSAAVSGLTQIGLSSRDLAIVMNRVVIERDTLQQIPATRSCAAMRRSMTESARGDFGQSVAAEAWFSLNWARLDLAADLCHFTAGLERDISRVCGPIIYEEAERRSRAAEISLRRILREMTQPDKAVDKRGSPGAHGPETVHPARGPGAELAAILDGYLAALQAGQAPDRRQLLDAHPELAAELEACLAGIDFIQRATGPAALGPASLGEFRIIREVGRGGMGVVYEAEQTSLQRKVALKVLRFAAVADEEAMKRFRREAETVARLHHTNIVPIFAVGCDRDVHYYAMQFIEGRSLAQVLAEAQERHKPLAIAEIVTWGLQAAEALVHAHQRGVIHRDIKPSNLLLDPEGVVWLTDFGLAKREDEATLTVRGALMGTPRYMSPEQAESLERPVDQRSDLYSLGASLYELATGRPVFDSPTPQGVIRQIISDEPARPRHLRPGLPRNVETVILKCLAKDPRERYQTARELAGDLAPFWRAGRSWPGARSCASGWCASSASSARRSPAPPSPRRRRCSCCWVESRPGAPTASGGSGASS